MESCFDITCNDIDNDNDDDFQKLLLYIILNFGPENYVPITCSTKKPINIYRKQAILKWLKKREKRTFAVYKVKNKNVSRSFIRDKNTGLYVVSTIKFIPVNEL